MTPRIGLVLKYLDEEYQASIFKGVAKEAERLGLEMICIQGDQFDESVTDKTAFFPSPAFPLDGIIFLSSILLDFNHTLPEVLRNTFGPRPLVSIGTALKGIPSIIAETAEPMANLIEHLFDTHGYRNFLHLGGPVGNQDSLVREDAIRRALKRKESITDPCTLKVFNAKLFSETAGLRLIQNYCKENPHRNVDVILAGSDNMAVGILKYLRAGAPSDWAECPITGFDDIPLSGSKSLALTTVHQPTELMGVAAVQTLQDMFNGIIPPDLQEIHGQTIIRNSCGCTGYTPSIQQLVTGHSLQREQFLRDVSYFGQEIMATSSIKKLTRPLTEFLTNVGTHDFALVLYTELENQMPVAGKIVLHGNPLMGINHLEENLVYDIYEIFDRLLKIPAQLEKPRCLFNLRSGESCLGFMLYSVDQSAHSYMSVSGMFLSHAIKRISEMENEQDHARNLEREVEKQTRELKAEGRRRRAVEEEVLKISDLERLRFSLDLHDDICQRLAAMTMVCKNGAEQNPILKTLFKMATDTLQKTRQYAHDSFPVEIDTLDISDALKRLCRDMDTGVKTSVSYKQLGNIVPLTREQKINIFRIAQEALQNVIKHSNAQKAVVQLNYNDSIISLIIRDDGDGYTASQPKTMVGKNNRRPRGLGIRSMEYRAHQLEGTFNITSTAKQGTEIQVTIPTQGEND